MVLVKIIEFTWKDLGYLWRCVSMMNIWVEGEHIYKYF